MTDTLPVNEAFGPTWQGEGPHAGRRASFVRLGRCNLSCSWCDSAHTWDSSRYDLDEENPEIPVVDVVTAVARNATGLTVVTGGEPLLYQRKPAFLHLLTGLSGLGEVHIETNGTIPPTRDVERLVQFISVSPKLSSTADPKHRRIRPAAIDTLTEIAVLGRACFKFVATCEADLDEVDQIVADHDIPSDTVWIMPEGTDAVGVIALHRQIADEIRQRGYNTTTRLQTLLWGAEPGH